MKVRISDSIADLYGRIVEYNSNFELRTFGNLTLSQKDELLKETFERRFKKHWDAQQRASCFEKDKDGSDDELMDDRVIDGNFKIAGRRVYNGFEANLKFDYNSDEKTFEIQIQNSSADTPNSMDTATRSLRTEIEDIKKSIETDYSKDMFLKDFFATLRAHRLTIVKPTEAALMHTIYRNALNSYPLFKKLSYDIRIKVMHDAYMRNRFLRNHCPDIYSLAKTTFDEFDAKGLITLVTMYDGVINQNRTYHLIGENRRTRVNPEIPSEIWEYNYLVFGTFEYTIRNGIKLVTSFHPSDLWRLLHGLR